MKKLLALMLLMVIFISFSCLTNDSGNDKDTSSDTTYTITGTVKDNSGSGIAGVSVNLIGNDLNLNVTTDTEGNYSFQNIINGTYTVSTSKSGYTFSLSDRTIEINGSNVSNTDFTGVPEDTPDGDDDGENIEGQIVTGRIVDLLGVVVPDIELSLTSFVNRYTAVTDQNGVFTFTGIPGAAYALLPIGGAPYYSYIPQFQQVSVSGADVTTGDFLQYKLGRSGEYNIYGEIKTEDGVIMPDVVLTLDFEDRTSTSDKEGNYYFGNLGDGDYTITPSREGFVFAPSSVHVPLRGENVGVDFTGRGSVDGWIVQGRIIDESGDAVPGVIMSITNPVNRYEATTGEDGSYAFVGVANGNYGLVTNKMGYTFTPDYQTIAVNDADVVLADIIGSPFQGDDGNGYNVAGRVVDNEGNGIGNVPVGLGGTMLSMLTDGEGRYSFANIENNDYMVIAVKENYTFTPQYIMVTVDGGPVNVADITGYTGGSDDDGEYVITGSIVTSSGAGIQGVAVILTGPGMSNTKATNENGVFTYPGIVNGTYTIVPYSEQYTFSPEMVTLSVRGGAVEAQTIIGTPVDDGGGGDDGGTGRYMISGHVYNVDDDALSGITIMIGGDIDNQSVMTNQHGYYSISNLENGDYLVIPTNPGRVFSPMYMAVTINGENETADFHEFQDSGDDDAIFKISGKVSDRSGNAISGVTIMLNGGNLQKTGVTNDDGDYRIEDLPNAFYSLIPQKSGYMFEPPFSQVTINGTNAITNFTGRLAADDGDDTFTVSGKIVDESGDGIPDVQVDIESLENNNMLVGRTKTDSMGRYSFADIFEGEFNIIASKAGYSFSPSPLRIIASASATNAADITGTRTSGDIPGGPRNITGRVVKIYDDDTGIADVIMKLEEKDTEDSLKVMTDAEGYYAFNGIPDGEYYIIPRHENFIFDNERKKVEVSGENLPDVNFKGAHFIAGHVYEEKKKEGGGEDETELEPKSGVKIKMTRLDWSAFAYGTATTDAFGYYEFRILLNPGEYKVEAPDEEKISPEFHEVIIVEENHLDVDFVIPIGDEQEPDDPDDDGGGGNILNFWLDITITTTQQTTERNDEQRWKGTANFVLQIVNEDGTGAIEGEGELRVSGGGHSQDDKGGYCDWTRAGTVSVSVGGSSAHTIDPNDDKIKHMLNISLGMASNETVTTTCCDDEGNCDTVVNQGGAQDLPYDFLMPMVEGYTINRTVTPGGGVTGHVVYVLHYGSNE